MKKIQQQTILIASITLSIVWIYQGLVPKILYTDYGEIAMLKHTKLFEGNEKNILNIIGWAEIVFGIVILFVRTKSIHIINIVALLLLLTGVFYSDMIMFTTQFNPFSLNVLMIGISVIVMVNLEGLSKKLRI